MLLENVIISLKVVWGCVVNLISQIWVGVDCVSIPLETLRNHDSFRGATSIPLKRTIISPSINEIYGLYSAIRLINVPNH